MAASEIHSFLSELIPSADFCIEKRQAYGIPFFYYRGKPICYLNEKDDDSVDLGFCNGAKLNINDIFPEARIEKVVLVKNFKSLAEAARFETEIVTAVSMEIDRIKHLPAQSR